ncbi:integrase core domain-containing protein [Streptomyces sp900116325]|uniref:integrase core domain-containing protein n=1 Tax=Streptomyces sp. 900116325 TaxID=3154295 RepID=UPI0033D0819C
MFRSRTGSSSISQPSWTASAARSSAGPCPPHAHQPGRRRTADGSHDPRPSGRRRVPLRPRNAIRIRVFAGLCDQLGVTRSMGAVGTSADSAACEGFRASLKRETLQSAHDYGDTCRRTLFAWLTRYNTRRRHSANGHLSPNEYEHRHHTATLTLAA